MRALFVVKTMIFLGFYFRFTKVLYSGNFMEFLKHNFLLFYFI